MQGWADWLKKETGQGWRIVDLRLNSICCDGMASTLASHHSDSGSIPGVGENF